jgi:hypothetical protein
MANNCVYTIDGKKYSYEEFRAYLADNIDSLGLDQSKLTGKLRPLEQFQKPKINKELNDFREKELGRDLEQEQKDLDYVEEELSKRLPKDAREELEAIRDTILEQRTADRKIYEKSLDDKKLTAKERIALQEEKERADYEESLRTRSRGEKAKDVMLGIIGIPRALQLGLDLSAIGVQGMRRLATSPIQSYKAFTDMMKQAFSEKEQEKWHKTLKEQDWYPVLKDSGLSITEMDGEISKREENFSNDYIKMITNKAFGKYDPYEASNRAFSGYLNSLRVQGFLEGMTALEAQGKTFESHPQDFKSWADYINNVTGRGSWSKEVNSSKLAQILFLSPRKIMSEANLINPVYWGNLFAKDKGKSYEYSLTPTVARKAFADFSLGMGVLFTASLLAKAAFGDDDEKSDKDFWNPTSSNFMSIQVKDKKGGKTVINLFGALKSEIVMLSRLISGKDTNAMTGKTTKIGDKQGHTRTDIFLNWLANKLGPAAHLTYAAGKQTKAHPLDVSDEAVKFVLPSWSQGIVDTYKDYPTSTALALTLTSLFGVQTTHLQKKKK